MTARDLTHDDIDGFLHAHKQRAEETRFAQLDDEWTPASALEDMAILLVVAFICCASAFAAGWALWKVLS